MGRARSTLVGLAVGFIAGILLAHALAVVGVQLRGRPIVVIDPFLGALLGAAIGFLYAPPGRSKPAPDPMGGRRGPTAAGVPPPSAPPSPRAAPAWSRATFAVLAGGFAVCLVVQVLLAGLAVFADPRYWTHHVRFVHVFELLPIAMALIALAGRLPRHLAWQSAGLFGLVFLMYFTANMRSVAPFVAALHPVLAVVLVLVATEVARQAWALTTPRDPGPGALEALD